MLDNPAKTLGLTFPITLLDRADEVIERLVSFWHKGDIPTALTNVRFQGVSSIGQCNTSCSLLAGVSKAKVFRGR
jgi:hypothetical protein